MARPPVAGAGAPLRPPLRGVSVLPSRRPARSAPSFAAWLAFRLSGRPLAPRLLRFGPACLPGAPLASGRRGVREPREPSRAVRSAPGGPLVGRLSPAPSRVPARSSSWPASSIRCVGRLPLVAPSRCDQAAALAPRPRSGRCGRPLAASPALPRSARRRRLPPLSGAAALGSRRVAPSGRPLGSPRF